MHHNTAYAIQRELLNVVPDDYSVIISTANRNAVKVRSRPSPNVAPTILWATIHKDSDGMYSVELFNTAKVVVNEVFEDFREAILAVGDHIRVSS